QAGRGVTADRFQNEVAVLYRLLGFDTKLDSRSATSPSRLTIEQRSGGLLAQADVVCEDKRITGEDSERILLKRHKRTRRTERGFQLIVVSSRGFAEEARSALKKAGAAYRTYHELLCELVPLDDYVTGLIAEYEKWVAENWRGEDWFIRPRLLAD